MSTGQARARIDDDVLAAVLQQAEDRAWTWLPGNDPGRTRVKLLSREVRPRCFLYRLEAHDGHADRRVIVKVRHSIAELRRVELFDVPVLAPERTLPDVELAHREYTSLQQIHGAFTALHDARFGALHPIDWFPDTGAIVMPEVREATLHDALIAASPLSRRAIAPSTEEHWHNIGSWLRTWHALPPALPTADRHGTRTELLQLLVAYRDFLAARTGRVRYFTNLADLATGWAERYLPATLPLVNAHGDFVPRNAFVADSGRVTVFDAMSLWRTPEYEDIARMTMRGLRLVNGQALSQGLVMPRSRLAAYETAFLHGYYGRSAVPVRQVRLYQLVLLLDRWCEVVGKASNRPSRRATRAAVSSLHDCYLRREADWLTSSPPIVGGTLPRTTRSRLTP